MAIATACFWGRPALTSVRILLEIVFRLEPFLSGKSSLLEHSDGCHVVPEPSRESDRKHDVIVVALTS